MKEKTIRVARRFRCSVYAKSGEISTLKSYPLCLLDVTSSLPNVVEQWELGFMRDLDVAGEVKFWFRVSHAFITYHRRKGMPVRSDEEELKFIGTFISLGPDPVSGESEEMSFTRECYEVARPSTSSDPSKSTGGSHGNITAAVPLPRS